jgi:hypothetical protein
MLMGMAKDTSCPRGVVEQLCLAKEEFCEQELKPLQRQAMAIKSLQQ